LFVGLYMSAIKMSTEAAAPDVAEEEDEEEGLNETEQLSVSSTSSEDIRPQVRQQFEKLAGVLRETNQNLHTFEFMLNQYRQLAKIAPFSRHQLQLPETAAAGNQGKNEEEDAQIMEQLKMLASAVDRLRQAGKDTAAAAATPPSPKADPEVTKEIQMLRKQVESLSEANSTVHVLNGKVNQLEGQLNNKTLDCQTFMQANQRLQTELQEEKKRCLSLDRKLDSERKAAKIVGQDITRYVDAMKKLEKEAESHQKEKKAVAESHQKDKKALTEEMKRLQQRLDEYSTALSAPCQTCLERSTSSSATTKYTDAIAMLEKEIDSHLKEKKDLKEEVKRLHQRVEENSAAINFLPCQTCLDRSTCDLKADSAIIVDTDNKTSFSKSYVEKIKALEREVEIYRKEKDDLAEEIKSFQKVSNRSGLEESGALCQTCLERSISAEDAIDAITKTAAGIDASKYRDVVKKLQTQVSYLQKDKSLLTEKILEQQQELDILVLSQKHREDHQLQPSNTVRILEEQIERLKIEKEEANLSRSSDVSLLAAAANNESSLLCRTCVEKPNTEEVVTSIVQTANEVSHSTVDLKRQLSEERRKRQQAEADHKDCRLQVEEYESQLREVKAGLQSVQLELERCQSQQQQQCSQDGGDGNNSSDQRQLKKTQLKLASVKAQRNTLLSTESRATDELARCKQQLKASQESLARLRSKSKTLLAKYRDRKQSASVMSAKIKWLRQWLLELRSMCKVKDDNNRQILDHLGNQIEISARLLSAFLNTPLETGCSSSVTAAAVEKRKPLANWFCDVQALASWTHSRLAAFGAKCWTTTTAITAAASSPNEKSLVIAASPNNKSMDLIRRMNRLKKDFNVHNNVMNRAAEKGDNTLSEISQLSRGALTHDDDASDDASVTLLHSVSSSCVGGSFKEVQIVAETHDSIARNQKDHFDSILSFLDK